MSSQLSTSRKREPRLLQSLLPSSLASVLVHCLVMLAMFLATRGCEQGVPAEAGGEQFRTIGITHMTNAANEQTDLDSPPTENQTPPQPGEIVPVPDVTAAVPEASPNVSKLLLHSESTAPDSAMAPFDVIGAGALLPGMDVSPQLIPPSGGSINGGSPTPGPNQTSFANIIDGGTRFVYLIDTSGSMSNHGRLGKAMMELTSSLRMLKPHQEFQVIFYGDNPTLMRLRSGAKKVYWANVRNVELALDELRNVELGGGTDHLSALEAALKLNPEVVYFLTDGQDASHTSGELQELLGRNKTNARIHVVEFAVGAPETRDPGWLQRLASRTGGEYRRMQL